MRAWNTREKNYSKILKNEKSQMCGIDQVKSSDDQTLADTYVSYWFWMFIFDKFLHDCGNFLLSIYLAKILKCFVYWWLDTVAFMIMQRNNSEYLLWLLQLMQISNIEFIFSLFHSRVSPEFIVMDDVLQLLSTVDALLLSYLKEKDILMRKWMK